MHSSTIKKMKTSLNEVVNYHLKINDVDYFMNDLIDKFSPMSMAIEDSFYSQNVKSVILLSQARGVLLLSAASKGISSMVYAPRKVKQSVTGNGSSSKKQVKYMVEKILNIDKNISSLDITDALAIGLCHINQNKYL